MATRCRRTSITQKTKGS